MNANMQITNCTYQYTSRYDTWAYTYLICSHTPLHFHINIRIYATHEHTYTHPPIKPERYLRLVIIEMVRPNTGNGLHTCTVIFEHISVVFYCRVQIIETLCSCVCVWGGGVEEVEFSKVCSYMWFKCYGKFYGCCTLL